MPLRSKPWRRKKGAAERASPRSRQRQQHGLQRRQATHVEEGAVALVVVLRPDERGRQLAALGVHVLSVALLTDLRVCVEGRRRPSASAAVGAWPLCASGPTYPLVDAEVAPRAQAEAEVVGLDAVLALNVAHDVLELAQDLGSGRGALEAHGDGQALG